MNGYFCLELALSKDVSKAKIASIKRARFHPVKPLDQKENALDIIILKINSLKCIYPRTFVYQ